MGKINWMTDYGVPVAVGGVELGLKAWDRSRLQKNPSAMEYEPLAPMVIGIGGTIVRVMNLFSRHDEMVKMAVAASLPRVVTGAYDWATKAVAGGVGRGMRVRQIRSVNQVEPPKGAFRSI